MPAVTRGVFTTGPYAGWRWEVVPDAGSQTGYSRRVWNPENPAQTSTTPYDFRPFIQDAEEADARTREERAAAQARLAQAGADNKGLWASENTYRDQQAAEKVRQYDKSLRETELARLDRKQQAAIALKEQQRQFDLGYGLDLRGADRADASLGLQTLTAGANLRGARDFVQGDAFAQGVADAGLSPYVMALGSGRPVKFGGGTATQGHPTPLTLGTLAGTMGGGGRGVDQYGRPLLSPGVQQAVDAGSQAFQGGLATKPLGFLENMSDSQRDGLRSIGSWLGRDVDAEETYYRRSRPGVGSALRS